ncbi:sensor histidine kinase [Marilutibacter aestuarii]|uniref:Sensor histidine kinase n=1 Tax=Marilutibacter aestuarii TaxID=1706195 RepID=A0A508ARH7_9GAMM|nr:histidine kinase [Lysobacter aestuarii]TQD51553.1 sensor histidine kinase [Lysobacter aestuarii]
MNGPKETQALLDTLWQPRTLVWVLIAGEGLAVVLALAPGGSGDRWVYFGLTSILLQWISLLTMSTLYWARRRLARLTPVQLAYAALVALMASTWVVSGGAWFLLQDLWLMAHGGWRSLILRLSGLALTVGMLGLAAFQNYWRARQWALRTKQAELEALQARIRPHFLFNTLNTGAALVHQRPEAVEQLLLDLADLFRAALAGPHQIPLQDELDLARRYLEIEGLRFRERLQVTWKLPRALPDVTVPALTIQPLVENAIRHGIERLPKGGTIEVAVTTSDERVIVRISNPLPGSSREARPGHNVGLNAAQERVEALTQGKGSVTTSREGDLYVATVRLPVSER